MCNTPFSWNLLLLTNGDNCYRLANEVWGKVIFSEACVKNSYHGGGGVSAPGGVVCSWGVSASGGVCSMGLLWGVPGGDPPDGHCCGRYASYWNAFLFFF